MSSFVQSVLRLRLFILPGLTAIPVTTIGWYTDSHVARAYQTRHNTQVAINPDTSL